MFIQKRNRFYQWFSRLFTPSPLPKAQDGFFTQAAILKNAGYTAAAIYTADVGLRHKLREIFDACPSDWIPKDKSFRELTPSNVTCYFFNAGLIDEKTKQQINKRFTKIERMRSSGNFSKRNAHAIIQDIWRLSDKLNVAMGRTLGHQLLLTYQEKMPRLLALEPGETLADGLRGLLAELHDRTFAREKPLNDDTENALIRLRNSRAMSHMQYTATRLLFAGVGELRIKHYRALGRLIAISRVWIAAERQGLLDSERLSVRSRLICGDKPRRVAKDYGLTEVVRDVHTSGPRDARQVENWVSPASKAGASCR